MVYSPEGSTGALLWSGSVGVAGVGPAQCISAEVGGVRQNGSHEVYKKLESRLWKALFAAVGTYEL